jgi:hypothetical protein
MSFAASCNLSKIPIKSGDNVYYIPITKNKNSYEVDAKVLRNSGSLFSPTMIPLQGTYNDYGSIENIVRDENVIHLENYYAKPIEDILKTMNDNRGIFDSIGNVPKIWDIKLSPENSIKAFKSLGFELKINEEKQEYYFNKEHGISIYNIFLQDKFEIEQDYKLAYTKKAVITEVDKIMFEKVGISLPSDKELSVNINLTNGIGDRTLQHLVYKELGIILGLANPEDSKHLKSLHNMTNSFANKEIYDKATNVSFREFQEVTEKSELILKTYVKELHLYTLGFEIKDKKNFDFKSILEEKEYLFTKDGVDILFNPYGIKIIKKHSEQACYNVKSFIDSFNLITKGEKLDISLIEHQHGAKTHINNALLNTKEFIILAKENNAPDSVMDKLQMKLLRGIDEAFKDILPNKHFGSLYKEFLLNSMLSPNSENKKEEINFFFNKINDFNDFEHILVASNNIFIPTMTGYQDGAIEVNRYLNKITDEIINEKNLEEREID